MHTVIIGGGFGGVKAALELSKKNLGRITVISDQAYFLHHATLYATATGRNTSESVVSLEDIFSSHHDISVVQDEITSFDPKRKLVIGKNKQYTYDNIIFAMGVVTTYFGIDGMQQHAYGIKTLKEVRAFKDHLHDELVADKHMDKNYVIIGAGPTGVELAGSLSQYLKDLAVAHQIKRAKINISLIEAAPRILPRLSKTASAKVQRRLEALGVKVLVNHKVQALSKHSITIDGKLVTTETAVWTSGVTNHPFFKEHADYFRLAQNGRVEVDSYLRASENVYVIGDNANTEYTGVAWTALMDAVFVANHLAREATGRRLVAYRPKKTAVGVPVGEKWAYVERYGVYAQGLTGYILRRYLELRGYRALLPENQALSAWRSHTLREESCKICSNRSTSDETVVKA